MNERYVLGLVAGLLLTACGSDDDSGGKLSCEPFVACGGALTGKWRVSNSCLTDQAKAQAAEAAKVCDQGTASISDFAIDGTATFDQQSVIYDGVISFAISSTFPLSCAGGAATCGDAQKTIASQQSVTGATCTTQGTSCACDYRESITIKKQGSYVVSGSTLTETDPSDGSKSTSEYCVSGDTLRMKSEQSIDVYTR